MRGLPAIAALAAILAGCGGDDGSEPTEPQLLEPTIAQIHRVTPDFTRETVRVTGTAVPVKEVGFVLAQGDDRIYVDGNPSVVRALSPGDSVTVTGEVRKIPQLIEDLLESPRDVLRRGEEDPGRMSKAARRALAQTPSDTGDPYIEADAVEAPG